MSTDLTTWTRAEIAARVAHDIPDGAYVNLGIGIPTLVADHVPAGRELVLHTENGMLGMGRAVTGADIDPDLINAGKIPVAEAPGASYFHHADSFALIRGGHLDVCVIGAYQVSSRGDLANWRTTSPHVIPGVGGAMDLAVGARSVLVAMELFTRAGDCKIVDSCSYPLTAAGCVDRVYTDHGVFRPDQGVVGVVELSDPAVWDLLVARTDLRLVDERPVPIS